MNLNRLIRIISKYRGGFSYLNIKRVIKDNFQKPRGSVRAVIEENGIEWVAHEQSNLIVNLARPAMAALLAEADTDYVVNTFKIGTQGHTLGPPEDILTPISPTVTDTSLIDGSPFSKSISSFSYLPGGNPTSVQFVSVLEKAEANGSGSVTYTEAGLFMDGGNMFARETFAAIVKNSARKVTFYWKVLY